MQSFKSLQQLISKPLDSIKPFSRYNYLKAHIILGEKTYQQK